MSMGEGKLCSKTPLTDEFGTFTCFNAADAKFPGQRENASPPPKSRENAGQVYSFFCIARIDIP
jgi:hypothetical protein